MPGEVKGGARGPAPRRRTRAVVAGELADVVRDREPARPRWVWDTARVVPALLADGVQVERAHDLRLGRLPALRLHYRMHPTS